MKAMILAAGYGTRLKPLTDSIPKALVPFNGEPMINYQIRKLVKCGFDEIIVNAHHFAEQITEYFKKNSLGARIHVSVEKEILGTGGGILNAEKFLKNEEFFLVVNVDVYTNFDFSSLIEFHKSGNAISSLAVQKRKTKRYLEFDGSMELLRRETENSVKENLYAFNGVHIISNKIFQNRKIEFSDIIDLYFELINKGSVVYGFNIGNCEFRDLGKIANLQYTI
ncbi:MAG: nucleotidyltransferase family protein [Ignavibacteriae bacterium]|nr:nucleotidyltransferase family protein [Ignavibacteriota bacterium]